MVQKRLILHLGTPKTGTTSLQNVLVAEEDRLSQQGIRYLKNFRAAINHNRLMMQLFKDDTVQQNVVRKLRRELDQSPESNQLISTEIAYGLRPTTRLLRAIGPERVLGAEIIIYVRRQDLLLEAMAKQKLKSGHYKGDLDTFIASRKGVGNYMSYIKNVQKRFPDVSVTCRPYDRSVLIDGDVIADFWQALGLQTRPDPTRIARSDNVTPCRELAIALSDHEFATPQHRRKVISAIQQAEPDLFRSKDILDADARRSVQEAFREENRALGEYCGYDIEALFNDNVDYMAESRRITDDRERAALYQRSKDVVEQTALRLHPETAQNVPT